MSIPHLIVLLVIGLIVLGPEKMPQAARMLGKAMAEFRRITGDFRTTVETEMREMEREAALKEIRQSFPEHAHYDLQTQETTVPATNTAALPAADTVPTAEAEAATASGKPGNGEPTPA